MHQHISPPKCLAEQHPKWLDRCPPHKERKLCSSSKPSASWWVTCLTCTSLSFFHHLFICSHHVIQNDDVFLSNGMLWNTLQYIHRPSVLCRTFVSFQEVTPVPHWTFWEDFGMHNFFYFFHSVVHSTLDLLELDLTDFGFSGLDLQVDWLPIQTLDICLLM